MVLNGLDLDFDGGINQGKEITLNVLFTDDSHIQCLNKKFRNTDRPTDVLAFPIMEKSMETGDFVLGDIAISVETAKRQAEEYNCSLEEELSRLLIHGILHLAGYDHMTNQDANKMIELQEKFLKKAKVLLLS